MENLFAIWNFPPPRELPRAKFTLETARDLSNHVSRRIPATTVILNNNNGDGCEEEMFYEKIIVIKVGFSLSVVLRRLCLKV